MPGRSVVGRWRSLTREQKFSAGLLCIIGVSAIAFSVVRLRSAIIRPFTTPVQQLVDLKKRMGPSEQDLAEQQRRTDTDGDGVSDWDELNIYKTSPYLRDSDSDGDQDNLEIAKGTDPNCPKGKTCVSSITGTEAADKLSSSLERPATSTAAASQFVNIPPREPKAVRAWLKPWASRPASSRVTRTNKYLRPTMMR